MKDSNYSYLTSLPAYEQNKILSKTTQCDIIMGIVRKGANTLLQISQISGILQAIVSARVSDLRKEKKVDYSGQVVYQNRLRKKIVITQPPVIPMGKQLNLL